MKTIYLDRSATTPLSDAAKKAIIDAMERYGNPSSLHSLGLDAEHLVTDARRALLGTLGAPNGGASELVFTASGTEANNTAIFGTAYAKPAFRGGRIIVSADEHPSVLEPIKRLEAEGFDVVRIPCPRGVFDMEAFRAAMTLKTFLVSVMLVNNETGAINDVAAIFTAARAVNPRVVCHTDAVQAFGKLKFSPRSTGADLISVSGHKIGAPKGVGALYISPQVTKTKSAVPYILGGGQERGMRSGTENTLGIAAFAAASTERIDSASLANIREKLVAAMPDGTRVNTPDGKYYSGIISLTCTGIKSETMLHYLSSRGIFVSSGSACSSNGGHASYVLTDFGLDPREADCTVRLSFDDTLTDGDIAYVCGAISDGVAHLQKMR